MKKFLNIVAIVFLLWNSAQAQYVNDWLKAYNIPANDSIGDDDYVLFFNIIGNKIYASGESHSVDTTIGITHYPSPFLFSINTEGDSIFTKLYNHSCGYGGTWGGHEVVNNHIYMNSGTFNFDATGQQTFLKTNLLGTPDWCTDLNNDYISIGSMDILNINNETLFLLTRKIVNNSTGEDDISLTKIDTIGNVIWRKEFGDTAYPDLPQKILYTPKNTYYIISNPLGDGTEHGYLGSDFEVREIDVEGNELNRTVLGVDGYKEVFSDGEITPDGGLILCGHISTQNTSLSQRGYIIKYDSTFEKEWEYTMYNGLSNEQTYLKSILVLEDSSYVVVGYHEENMDGRILQFANDGVIIWDTVVNPTYWSKNPFRLVEGVDSSIIISGSIKDFTLPPEDRRDDMYFARWSGFAPAYHLKNHICDFSPNANYTSIFENNQIELTNTSSTNSAQNPIISYQWDFGDGVTDTTQNPIHTFTDATNYTIQLVVRNVLGCKDTLERSRFYVGISPLLKTNGDLKVFPNPATSVIHVVIPASLRAKRSNLCIYNSLGQKTDCHTPRLSASGVRNDVEIDVSNYPNGVYFVVLQNENEALKSKFLVK